MKPLKLSKPSPAAKAKRGFACMRPDTRAAICSAGGRALSAKRGSKWMARIGRIGGKK